MSADWVSTFPPTILTNADLERIVDTNDEWITSRTGIKERHVARDGQTTSDLALLATREALAHAGMTPEDLTHLFVHTLTPDSYCPSTACRLEDKLGIKHRMAVDVNAACSGFLYTLQMARATICMEPESVVLVAPSEILSYRTNWTDRSTCVLFGDGAGAVILTGQEHPANVARVVDVVVSSDGALADLLTVMGGASMHPYTLGSTVGPEYFVAMQGREVYKHAARNMDAVSREVLGRNGLTPSDVDLLIPHQANARIMDAVAKKLDLPPDRVYINIDRYGNTSAASVVIAMTEAWQTGRIKPGDKVLVTTFGGGFTWGAGLFQF